MPDPAPDAPPSQPIFTVEGNRLTLLDTGPRRLDALLALIDGATRSLRILYYIYADDTAAVTAHLDLHDAIHVGHSTGGGEVVRYIARHGESRVAKAVLISSVPPLMVQTDANPGGLPKEVFDGFQVQVATNRSGFYRDLAAGPFYGFNRPGAQPSEAIIENWWRQGMMGGAKAHYDGIVAFSQTDFTEDLKKITVPVLVMHGDDDQIVPYADSGPLSAKLVRNGTLKTYHGFPHGMPTTQAETINADLLAFVQS